MRDAGVLDQKGHFGCRRVLVQRHGHGTQPLRGAHRGIQTRAVVPHQRHMPAPLQPARGQCRGNGLHLVAELAPAQSFPDAMFFLANGGKPTAPLYMQLQQLRESIGLA